VGRWLGIDFSGNHLKWRPGCGTTNVWIADLHRDRAGLRVHDVRRVQQLAGAGSPFDRLATLLSTGEYEAAGIDAPFSVPDHFVRRAGSHAVLLSLVGSRTVLGRPFIRGGDLVQLVSGRAPPLTPPDTFWLRSGVNIRSPLWKPIR
jgi:hypothetical protein